MNFLEMPRRLALVLALQIVACVYVVLGIGALVKFRLTGRPNGISSDLRPRLCGSSLTVGC